MSVGSGRREARSQEAFKNGGVGGRAPCRGVWGVSPQMLYTFLGGRVGSSNAALRALFSTMRQVLNVRLKEEL